MLECPTEAEKLAFLQPFRQNHCEALLPIVSCKSLHSGHVVANPNRCPIENSDVRLTSRSNGLKRFAALITSDSCSYSCSYSMPREVDGVTTTVIEYEYRFAEYEYDGVVAQQSVDAKPLHPWRGRLRPGREVRPFGRIVTCSNVVRFVCDGDGESTPLGLDHEELGCQMHDVIWTVFACVALLIWPATLVILCLLSTKTERALVRVWLTSAFGAFLGFVLAMLTPDSLCDLLAISNKEGGRGMFVIIFMLPISTGIGALIAVGLSRFMHRPNNECIRK